MGYTEKLPNGKHRARWFDQAGRQRSRTFERERDAKRHVRNVESDIDRGVYVDENAGKTTFGDYAAQYFAIAEQRLARTSVARDRHYLNNHVLPRWERVPLNRIKKNDVEKWIIELAEPGQRKQTISTPLAPATIEKIYQTFRKVLVAAVEDDCIAKLPCPLHPPIKRAKQKPIRFLTEEQVAQLASTIDPRHEAMVYAAGYGGFRIGELVALRLDDIDWTRSTIRVDEGLTDVDGIVEFVNPKTKKASRTVPMADLALEKLRQHIDQRRGWADPTALLFTAPHGGTLRPERWRKREFAQAVREAKLAPLTPHDLRHTAASLFISAGANPWMLAEILGHSDTRMIDRVYGHLFEKDRDDLRQKMSDKAKAAAAREPARSVRRHLRSV